jgi:hypothetical protein
MKANSTTTPRTGRKPLPIGQAKESVYVGLTSVEIEALDRRCKQESQISGVDITRSELLRKAWLEYESKRKELKPIK